eukprot:s3066_g5.t1
MVNELEGHGFVVPLTQLPEYFVAENIGMNQLHKDPVEEEPPEDEQVNYIQDGGDSEMEDWDMFMEVEDGLVKIADNEDAMGDQQVPGVFKVEVSYTKDVEQILRDLQGPLEVTYTVDPREVQQHLELWRPAIEKEVSSVEDTKGGIRALIIIYVDDILLMGEEEMIRGDQTVVYLNQRSYVEEIARSYDFKEGDKGKNSYIKGPSKL